MVRKKPDADEVVSAPVLAKRLGVTPTTVSKLGGDGILIRSGRGRYRLWSSVLGYVSHLRKASTSRASPTAVARSTLLRIQASRAQLQFDREAGNLVSVDQAHAMMVRTYTDIR